MKRRRDGALHSCLRRIMRAGMVLYVGVCGWCCATSVSRASATTTANETSEEPFTLTAGSGLKWVRAADTREGHAAACLRNGLDPTPPEVFLSDQITPPTPAAAPQEQDNVDDDGGTISERGNSSSALPPAPAQPLWSEAVLTLVANGFGLDLERPGGVAGCCVPGMWCGPRGCYTLAFGDAFYNHGGYVGIPHDEYSIFTCKDPSVPLAAPANSTASSSASDVYWSTDSGYASVQPSDNNINNDTDDDNSSSIATSGDTAQGNDTDTAETTIDVGDSAALTATFPPTQTPPEPASPAGDVSDGSPPPPVRPTVVGVSPEVVAAGEALTLVGTGFGEAVEDVRVMVGGRDCRDPELCHLVCRPCGDEDRCEFDEMCMEDGLSKEKVCLPICDGTEGSCPCDHRCLPKRFELQGEPHSMVVNLCRPPDADPNFLCHGSVLRDQERIQCTVPVLVWDQAETESSPRAGAGVGKTNEQHRRSLDNQDDQSASGDEAGEDGAGEGQTGSDTQTMASVSLSVADRGATWEGGVAFAPRECGCAEDCDDGDACSFDACVEGNCVHTGVQEGYGCQAQPADVMWRGDAYRYFQIVDQADPVEQAEFVAEVEAKNKVSTVTNADDYPVEFHNWVEFPVYGTKYEDIYISPNGALFVPPLQTVVPGGLSAVSPSTEAFFSVLKADWNPSDSRASSAVLVMIEDDQFSVLYEDVFLFKRSASATPSTFSTTVFPDGSLRYRYIRIGDKADWTVGVSGNSFVSPTIRDRHVVQSEFIQMDKNGLPAAAAAAAAAATARTSQASSDDDDAEDSMTDPSTGAPASGANASDADNAAAPPVGDDGGEEEESSGVTLVASDNDADGDDTSAGQDGGSSSVPGEGDLGTEVTLCRAPTLACLGRACGKAGTEIPVLWEGFGCRAAAALNMTFSCRIGGVEVPAVSLEEPSSWGEDDDGGFDWTGRDGQKEEDWGPDWGGVGEREAGGLVCKVPRLEWVEAGQEQTVMVPVEMLWSLPAQASASAQQQVRLGASDVGVRGLSVIGDSGVVNSHVLAFRYYRDGEDAPDCGCSPAPRKTELTCDSCLVCGGDDSTKDCGGFCHGEAYVSPCGDCSGGMTGDAGSLWCEEYREYLDGPAQAALLSLSQSIMMLVALSIMTAFLTTCLFLARALMLRGVLAVERDRHGTLRRRVFSRHRGLSPSELECLETFEYSTVGATTVSEEDAGDDDSTHGGGGGGGTKDGSVGIKLCRDDRALTAVGASAEERGPAAEEGTGDQAEEEEEEEEEGAGGGVSEAACLLDCAICLAGLEDGDVLRKLPCRHFFHQECVDEWLHLSVSCPLCKRSARDGIRRHRRRRRRAREAAQRSSSHRDRADTDTAEAALVHAMPRRSSAHDDGGRFRDLPSSLGRLFSRARGGGVGRTQWQHVGDNDDGEGEEEFAAGRGGGNRDNSSESPPPGSDDDQEDLRRRRIINANVAAFFGEAEPSPRTAAAAPLSPTRGVGRGGGHTIVRAALEAFFRGPGGGTGRRGGTVHGAAVPAEYELAPVETADGIRNADVV